jgi:hypothetical protein
MQRILDVTFNISRMGTTMTPIALTHADVQAAAADGLISAHQAAALWQRWSAKDISSARTVPAALAPFDAGPTFGFTNVLYSFGGMVAIGAMSLFMTLGFERLGAGGLLAIGQPTFLPA